MTTKQDLALCSAASAAPECHAKPLFRPVARPSVALSASPARSAHNTGRFQAMFSVRGQSSPCITKFKRGSRVCVNVLPLYCTKRLSLRDVRICCPYYSVLPSRFTGHSVTHSAHSNSLTSTSTQSHPHGLSFSVSQRGAPHPCLNPSQAAEQGFPFFPKRGAAGSHYP